MFNNINNLPFNILIFALSVLIGHIMAAEDRAYAEEQKEKSAELFKDFRLNFKGISETQISAIKQIGAKLRAEARAEERERDFEENAGTIFY